MCDPIACSNCDFWCGGRGDVDRYIASERENGRKGELGETLVQQVSQKGPQSPRV